MFLPRRKKIRKTSDGILIFPTTPEYLKLAESVHLNTKFNKAFMDSYDGISKPIKLLPAQYLEDPICTPSGWTQKNEFKFTNNGIYSAQKVIAKDVVQIDVHSQLPTFARLLGLFDKTHERLYIRKKMIEAIPDYKSQYKLVKERKKIKDELNIFCSTNDTRKGRYVNRLLAVYSSMNFIFDTLNYWGISNILECLNDGFILKIQDMKKFETQFATFKEHYQKMIPNLTFSCKSWKYVIIKNSEEYLLINSPMDYKCRNQSYSKNAIYRKLTGVSLKTLSDNEIDKAALLNAKSKEREVIKMLYNYLFTNIPIRDGLIQELNKSCNVLCEFGVDTAMTNYRQMHYYTFSLASSNKGISNYIDKFIRNTISDHIYMSPYVIQSRENLFGQVIKAKEIKDIDSIINRRIKVLDFVPCVIDGKKKSQSLRDWIKYQATRIDQSHSYKNYQFDLLALTSQLWALENKGNPNEYIKYIDKLRSSQAFRTMDLSDIIYNDPRTAVVNGRLMVKDKHNVLTARNKIVNHLLKEHFSSRQKQRFESEKNNLMALLNDEQYHDILDPGFKSDHQTIRLGQRGEVLVTSPFKYNICHHINVDYDSNIVNDPAYYQVNSFLHHLAPHAEKQLKAMLGLIPLQHTDLIKEIRRFFILKGVSGAGKSTLAKLLEGIFDENDQIGSNIVSNTQNVNKAFTDEHFIDLNDTQKGMIMLWFDDFQSSSKTNIITANTGTVINGVITGVAQNAAAKYEREHPVMLPPLIVIATNAMPQITQEGTAKRMFVIESPKTLKEDPITNPDGTPVSVNEFLHNKKVLKALLYIIIQQASKLLAMSEKERTQLFDLHHSAANAMSNLNDSLALFFEQQKVTSKYDLIGIQAIKLFEEYQSSTHKYDASYRAFINQLEMMGLVLKRKHIGHNNYQKVICANNNNLTQAKIKAMHNELSLLPDMIGSWNPSTRKANTLKTWHYGYEKLKQKYIKEEDIFADLIFRN